MSSLARLGARIFPYILWRAPPLNGVLAQAIGKILPLQNLEVVCIHILALEKALPSADKPDDKQAISTA